MKQTMNRQQSTGSSGPHKSSSPHTPQQQQQQQQHHRRPPQPQPPSSKPSSQPNQSNNTKKATSSSSSSSQPCKNATSTANAVWSQVVQKMNCNNTTSQMNNVVGSPRPPTATTMSMRMKQQHQQGRRSKDSSRQQQQQQHKQSQQQITAQSRRKIVMQNDGLYHVHSNENGDKQYTPLDLEELENMSHGQIVMPNSPLHPTPRGVVHTNTTNGGGKGVGSSQTQLPQQQQHQSHQQFQPMAAWGPGQRPANLFNGNTINNTNAPLMTPPPPPPPQQPMLLQSPNQSQQQKHQHQHQQYPQQQYNQQPNHTIPSQQPQPHLQQQGAPLSPHQNPNQRPINNAASYEWDVQNVQRFLDMRAEMLAVLVFAARPNNNSNANTNGNTTNADTMNASNNTKAGGGATLQLHQQQQEQQVTNEQQQQQQPLLVRSHSEQLPTSPTRPNDDLLDASASTRSSSANKGFIRAATTGTGDVRPSAVGGGGGEPSMMPALNGSHPPLPRQQQQRQSQQQLHRPSNPRLQLGHQHESFNSIPPSTSTDSAMSNNNDSTTSDSAISMAYERILPSLQLDDGYFSMAIRCLLMDTPLPMMISKNGNASLGDEFVKIPSPLRSSKVNTDENNDGNNINTNNANMMHLIPRYHLRKWYHWARYVLLTNLVQQFFGSWHQFDIQQNALLERQRLVEEERCRMEGEGLQRVGGGVSMEGQPPSPFYQHSSPTTKNHLNTSPGHAGDFSIRKFTMLPETLKALAALSIMADQYQLQDDGDGAEKECKEWFTSLEKIWKDWNSQCQIWHAGQISLMQKGLGVMSLDEKKSNGSNSSENEAVAPLRQPPPIPQFPQAVPPGPIDNRILLSTGHSLLMHRHVCLTARGITHDAPNGNEDDRDDDVFSSKEEMNEASLLQHYIVDAGQQQQQRKRRLAICPIPTSFYQMWKRSFGVLCYDGTLAPPPPVSAGDNTGENIISNNSSRLMYHVQWKGCSEKNNLPLSVEFQRKVLPVPLFDTDFNGELSRRGGHAKSKSPYSKMMQEARNGSSNTNRLKDGLTVDTASSTDNADAEQGITRDTGVTVEVFPVEFRYVIVDDGKNTGNNDKKRIQGVALASRTSSIRQVLRDLERLASPDRSPRLWKKSHIKAGVATKRGDGYEILDVENLTAAPSVREMNNTPSSPKKSPGKTSPAKSWAAKAAAASATTPSNSKTVEGAPLTIEQWLGLPELTVQNSQKTNASPIIVELLVEVRGFSTDPRNNWARAPLELDNRIQVGDYVDAQDSARKWYETIVREVKPDSVKVHYMGWGSKWDAVLPRRKGSINSKLLPPAPLWSKAARWREQIRVGDEVEIRESTSLVQRPKWHRATVLVVGNESDMPRELGGAELEELEENGRGKKIPLLLLKRKQQIMVEVPQEIHNCSNATPLTPPRRGNETNLVPQPPYRRWVNLYSEEICKVNTHKTVHKKTSNSPATLNYTMESKRAPVEVMKPFNNIHGSGFVRESLRGIPPAAGTVGLHNLGNSCYMNSILQCVNHIKPITQYFLKGDYLAEMNKNNPLGSGGRLATAYSRFLNDIYSGEYSILAPRILKQTVGLFAPQFNNTYQHDSQEFCQYLMDGLHEDLNRVKDKPYVEHMEAFGMKDSRAAMESWKKHLQRHDSIFVDYTQGMHRSHLTCPSCGRESIKFDVYSSISLPLVPAKNRASIPLKDCLDQFAAGEQLDEHNAWYCTTCKKHVCALKLITLWNTPDILVLHLKRFTFEKCPTVDGRLLRRKIEDRVDFPIDRLDLSSYILGPKDPDAPPIYKLFGVSEHTGTTANSGHYTATVRNSEDGNWYRYNDSHVGSTSGDASVTGGAYLLFYQRVKGSLRWAGMEKQMEAEAAKQQNANQQSSYSMAAEEAGDGFREVTGKKNRRRR